jgi:hypothetical protein
MSTTYNRKDSIRPAQGLVKILAVGVRAALASGPAA